MKIPKIVHQIWFQGCNNIPKKYYANIASVRKYSPDWKYKCWSDKELYEQCLQYNDQCAATYRNYKHMHQKMDLARYVILYNIGGMYIDMDCEVLQPLDNIPGLDTKDIIICRSASTTVENILMTTSLNTKVLTNGVILSSPKNIYIKSLIDDVLKVNCDTKYNPLYKNKQYCILKSTGPVMFTNIFTKYANDPNVLILDNDYFEPCFSLDKSCSSSNKTIINHKHELTWLNGPMIGALNFYTNTKNYLIPILCCILLLIILFLII